MVNMTRFTHTPLTDALLELALAEDLGCGDATAEALIPAGSISTMTLLAREQLVFCGRPVLERLLGRFVSEPIQSSFLVEDGALMEAGQGVVTLTGDLVSLLAIERTALNFLQRMSGVATFTHRFVSKLSGTKARLVDTRKTLPGYRAFDKYATRVGGAHNHRYSLDGGILIKDNHLRAAGGIQNAVQTARQNAPHSLRIEVEVESLEGLKAAISANADVVMLDNFTPQEFELARAMVGDEVWLEASGGITLENVRAYAEAGADLIAVGALTHSAPSVDLAAEIL